MQSFLRVFFSKFEITSFMSIGTYLLSDGIDITHNIVAITNIP